jgi:hypothetical protein
MQTVLSRSASKAFVVNKGVQKAARPSVSLRASAPESAEAIFDPKGDGYECECLLQLPPRTPRVCFDVAA